MDFIKIRGTQTHKLKNINLDLPRNRLPVITSLSGSGNSSLAFDTLYAAAARHLISVVRRWSRRRIGRSRDSRKPGAA